MKLLGLAAASALLFGALAAPADAARYTPKYKLTGTANGAIDTEGAFSADVNAVGTSTSPVAASVSVDGQIADGSGIGKRTLKGTTSSGTDGTFEATVSGKGVSSATVTGTLVASDGTGTAYPIPSTITVTIKCTITYSPLRIVCTITITTKHSAE